MSTSVRALTAASAALFILGLNAAPSTARPDAGPRPPAVSTPTEHACVLARVGEQYTKCEDLTGNGVPAPDWIPQR